jgi:hypothetical protein
MVILLEVVYKSVIIKIIVRFPRISSITDKTPLMLHPTVLVELVVVVKALSAKPAEGMSLEASLVGSTGFVIAVTHVLFQFAIGK